jgi:dipeptide/tripeptide permease
MADIVWPAIMVLNAAVIILLGIIFARKAYREKKEGQTLKDERTAKINGKAAVGAFWISYAFMLSLLIWIILADEIIAVPELDVGWTVISIMIVSSVSFIVLRWYHNKKGESF